MWTRVLLVLHALAPFFRSSALMIGVRFDVLATAGARGSLARRRDVGSSSRRSTVIFAANFKAAVAPER